MQTEFEHLREMIFLAREMNMGVLKKKKRVF